MWDSPYEMITPLPSPFIYVVKGGGHRKEKNACRGTGEIARWEDHRDFGGRVAVMWRPSDTRGHHPVILSPGGNSAVLLSGKSLLMHDTEVL